MNIFKKLLQYAKETFMDVINSTVSYEIHEKNNSTSTFTHGKHKIYKKINGIESLIINGKKVDPKSVQGRKAITQMKKDMKEGQESLSEAMDELHEAMKDLGRQFRR